MPLFLPLCVLRIAGCRLKRPVFSTCRLQFVWHRVNCSWNGVAKTAKRASIHPRFIHLFNNSSIHSFIYSFIHSFIHSFSRINIQHIINSQFLLSCSTLLILSRSGYGSNSNSCSCRLCNFIKFLSLSFKFFQFLLIFSQLDSLPSSSIYKTIDPPSSNWFIFKNYFLSLSSSLLYL